MDKIDKFVEIELIEVCDEEIDVYDIEVENNHNFFANGILVHNCIAGYPNYAVLSKQEEGDEAVQKELKRCYEEFIEIFGKDRYFLELQFNKLEAQHTTNRHFIKFAKENNVPLVATADFHYFEPGAWKSREVMKNCAWSMDDDFDPNTVTIEDLKCQLYPKNAEQMLESYEKYCGNEEGYDDDMVKTAINNSHEIATNLINEVQPDTSPRLTQVSIRGYKSEFHKLVDLCKRGMVEKKKDNKSDYMERLKVELRLIRNKKLSPYFLAMYDMMNLADKYMFVGAARGSAAGSLVCYLLNITQVDPLKFGLLFERFLNEGRGVGEYPDIDCDVEDRDEFVNLLYGKYGEDSVFPISTYSKLQVSSLVKDLAKLLGVPYVESNILTKKVQEEIDEGRPKEENKAMYMPSFEKMKKDSSSLRKFVDEYPVVNEVFPYLYTQIRQLGRHAGGVIVYDDFASTLPTTVVKGQVQTAFTEGVQNKNLPAMGGVKFDMLGLKTIRMAHKCIELILRDHEIIHEGRRLDHTLLEDKKTFYNKYLHPDNVDFTDRKVYNNVWKAGNFLAVFQFQEHGARHFAKEAQPINIEEVAAITSIYRPGPLAIGVDKEWIEVKEKGKKAVKFSHKITEEILRPTYGFPIFQEQLMLLGKRLGNLSWESADKLRKVLIPKSRQDVGPNPLRDKIYGEFLKGCIENGYEDGAKLWSTMSKFSGYAFNKSHAISYSLISYQCAWLLTYYPIESAAAVMSREDNEKIVPRHIQEIEKMGFSVLPPDINESGLDWEITPDRKGLRRSLGSVKGIGPKAVIKILANQPYSDFLSHVFRSKVMNKTVITNLISINGFSSTNFPIIFKNRKQAIEILTNRKAKEIKTDKMIRELVETVSVDDFTREEDVDEHERILKYVPNYLLFSDKEKEILNKWDVQSIEDWSDDRTPVWFLVDQITQRKTRTGKAYLTVKAKGMNAGATFKIWGVDKKRWKAKKNDIYLGFFKRDDYGLSCGNWNKPVNVAEFEDMML